jgi:hypothetical protein
MKISGVRILPRLRWLCYETLRMADCQENGRIRSNCPSLTSIFSELYIHPPDSKYLFIWRLLWDFTVDKCESRDILPQSNRENILATIPLSYRFSEGLSTFGQSSRYSPCVRTGRHQVSCNFFGMFGLTNLVVFGNRAHANRKHNLRQTELLSNGILERAIRLTLIRYI